LTRATCDGQGRVGASDADQAGHTPQHTHVHPGAPPAVRSFGRGEGLVLVGSFGSWAPRALLGHDRLGA